MRNKNFAIGLIVVLAILGIYYYFRQYRQNAPSALVESLSLSSEEESVFEAQVGIEIPEGVEKTKLVGAGDETGMGIATRKFDQGKFEHTLTADLPEPEEGKFYQGWLGDESETIPTEKMEEKKGGWFLSYTADDDKSDYTQVMVTMESEGDDLPEEKILEGEF